MTAEPGADFEGWYAREHPKVLALMMVASGDFELAHEATAEAFARALERWDRVSAMERPGGWTYRVALNVVNRVRRRRALEMRLLRRHHRDEYVVVQPPELDLELWEAVRDLPERMRTAVALRYVADLTEREVADIMGIAAGTVAATLHAARRKLAERLDDAMEVNRG